MGLSLPLCIADLCRLTRTLLVGRLKIQQALKQSRKQMKVM